MAVDIKAYILHRFHACQNLASSELEKMAPFAASWQIFDQLSVFVGCYLDSALQFKTNFLGVLCI
jgi:hypothetical protein